MLPINPFKNSLDTLAAACGRRISAEIKASALTERRDEALFSTACQAPRS